MSAGLRIGYDASSLGARAGIGRYSRELLRALASCEPEHEYVLLNRPRYMPSRVLWMQGQLPLQLRAGTLDLCHFTNYHAPVMRGRPFVVTLHDLSLMSMPGLHPRRRVALGRALIRSAVRSARAIVTPSQSVRAEAIHLLDLDPGRVHVVHEAPAAAFRPIDATAELESTAARYGLRPGFLLAIGTLEPRKNLRLLLAAFQRLRRQGFDEPLVLCGAPGWRNDDLMRQIREQGADASIRLLGYVADVDLPRLLNLAGAFVYPSLYEGFGLPVLEALACGTPTVTSNHGALQEIAGDAALHADPGSLEDLTRSVSTALFDTSIRGHLRNAGLRRAAQFTWADAAHRTAALYRQTAGAVA
jgi:glycosyltransferase involved in cell wall biosynthesis